MTFRRLLIGLLPLVIVSLSSCSAQPKEITLEERIDELLISSGEQPAPGYAIGVVKDGMVSFAKGYGLADISTGAAITPDTPFNLASLSKQFTGAAIALEIQKNSLALDGRLSDYWPELPHFMHDITVGHLVYMTSGLPEYYSLPSPKGGWESEDEFTVQDAISTVLVSKTLEYAPGTQWTYSNINYQLLAELSAKLNGTSFSAHLAANIFEPLNMQNTWVDDELESQARAAAMAYVRRDASTDWREAPRLSPHYGGSGVFASIYDLAKWDKALFETKAFGNDFTDIMLSTKKYRHEKSNDAFGLVHGAYKEQPTIWYEGGDYGVSTYMIRFTNQKTAIICLANFAPARCREISMSIADFILSEQ